MIDFVSCCWGDCINWWMRTNWTASSAWTTKAKPKTIRSSTSDSIDEPSGSTSTISKSTASRSATLSMIELTTLSQQTESASRRIRSNRVFNPINPIQWYREYNLKPHLNNFLIAPKMKTVVHTQDARRETFNDVPAAECHFLHVDEGLVAAFSHCSDNEIVISNHVGDFVSFDLIFCWQRISTVISWMEGKRWKSDRSLRVSGSSFRNIPKIKKKMRFYWWPLIFSGRLIQFRTHSMTTPDIQVTIPQLPTNDGITNTK